MSARGEFSIPPALGFCSPCLVAEAVGQLAAWSAMAAVDFQVRPLAGIAGAVRVPADVRPGDVLDLAVAIDHCDETAVAYSGSASLGGRTVLALDGCVGPMFAMEDYDSPDSIRTRYELLLRAGEAADRFDRLDRGEVEISEHRQGRQISGELRVPTTAAFFADHFPRRPLYPATLLLDHQIGLALALAADASPLEPVRVDRVVNAKMRSFVLPGQEVRIEAAFQSDGRSGRVALTASADGKRVSTAVAEISAAAA